MHKLLLDPARPERLWQQNHFGVYRSHNRGESWERLDGNGLSSARFERPRLLAGRGAEGARLDRLLADARAGQSAVLVLRGEPGIGKTALLGYAAERAAGFRVVSGRPGSSRRWSCRSPACISCAGRCWAASGGCRHRNAMRSGRRSV